MKKVLLPILVLTVALGLALPMAAAATQGSLKVVSDTQTKLDYWGLDGIAYPVTPQSGLPAGWNSDPDFDDGLWASAVLFQHGAWFPQTTTAPFSLNGAKWISPSTNQGAGPDYSTSTGPRGVYLYRKVFGVPATAYNVSGTAAIGSDNYGWLYLNGYQLLEPKDKTQYDRNFLASVGPSTTAAIPVECLSCENVLAAEVHNGVSISANGPTGVIFSLELDYELPDVAWQPPVTNTEFVLQDGTTLPLKFKLYTQDGTLITDMQNVYMTVYDTSTDVVTWDLGEGIDSLRWNDDEDYYIANLKTRDYELADGTYTAVVYDSCSDDVLGSWSFELSTSKGSGRGNK